MGKLYIQELLIHETLLLREGTEHSDKRVLTLSLLTCRIWWATNNASKWQMGFNSAFKGLNSEQFHALCTEPANITLHRIYTNLKLL